MREAWRGNVVYVTRYVFGSLSVNIPELSSLDGLCFCISFYLEYKIQRRLLLV